MQFSQETETEANKREDRLNRKKKKLNSSEIMETLREEFSTAPEVTASSLLYNPSVFYLYLCVAGPGRSQYPREFRPSLLRLLICLENTALCGE
jgi:hypothetical protein